MSTAEKLVFKKGSESVTITGEGVSGTDVVFSASADAGLTGSTLNKDGIGNLSANGFYSITEDGLGEASGGNMPIKNPSTTETGAQNAARGASDPTALMSFPGARETTSATVTPSAGWTTVTASPIRISQSPIGYSIASGGMTRTSSTVTYNDIVATYTGVTLTRDVEIHSSVFDGTNYIAGQARIDTSGDIKWRGQTTTNVSAIIINGVLE